MKRLALMVVLTSCSPFATATVEVDRVSPMSGRNTSDVPVRVEGVNFHVPVRSDIDRGETELGDLTVSIGDTPLTGVRWQSTELIDGVVPAGLAPGLYPVTVTLGDHADVLDDAYRVVVSSARAIDIVDAQVVGGPHAGFPVLFSAEAPWLRDLARGGEVARADGFDLSFTADAAGTVRLAYEVERYDPAIGALVAWIAIPALDASTTFYIQYGDAAIAASQEDVPGVWSSGYELVMHMNPALADAAGVATAFDELTTSNGPGQVEGAKGYGIGNRVIVSGGSALTDVFTGGGTSEGWFNASSIGENGFGRFFDKGHINGWSMSLDGTRNTLALVYGSEGGGWGEWLGAMDAIVFSSWHHAAIVFDADSSANDPQLYIDGVATTVSEVVSPSGAMDTDAPDDLYIGNRVTSDRAFDGFLDELRLSTVMRSPGWLATQYRNQVDPSAFYTVGAPQ